MSWQSTVDVPVGAVFAVFADPSRLGDWLPEVTGPAAPPSVAEAGVTFALAVCTGPAPVPGNGEVTACEPPWLVGYRLFIGPHVVTFRVTCAAHSEGTQVRLHQAGGIELAVDLDRLSRAAGKGRADGQGRG